MRNQVANTIKQQIGINTLMHIGAHNLCAIKDGLALTAKANNGRKVGIHITLDPSDTYNVHMFNSSTSIYKGNDIYCDSLAEILERNLK